MTNALVTYYIDVNIGLMAAAALWLSIRFLLARLGYRFSFQAEHNLIFVFLGLAVLGPVLARASGFILPAHFNLTDWLVSWYLGGGIDMSARQVQSIIGAKGAVIDELVQRNSWFTNVGLSIAAMAFGFFCVRLGQSALSLRRILRNSFTIKRIDRIAVVASDRIEVPFTTRGWRQFYIVLPVDMLGDSWKMKIAMAHEMQHIRNGDVTWEYVWSIVHPLLFLNPAFGLFRRRLNVLRELICDAALLERPQFNKRRYCETLLSVARSMNVARRASGNLAVPFVEPRRHLARRGQSSLEYRILYALELPSAHRHLRFGWLGMSLTIFAASLMILILLQKPSEWSHDRIMLSTIANLEHLEQINQGDQ